MYVREDIMRKESEFGKLEIVDAKKSIEKPRDPRKGKCPTASLETIYLEVPSLFINSNLIYCVLA